MQTILERHWHQLPTGEVVELLDSDPQQGLDLFEIRHRLERFGPNRITPQKAKSPILRFLLQFHNPLIYILLASSAITAFIKDPLDGVIILAVVLINAVIGYMQESKAEQAIQALTKTMTTETAVIRSGQLQRVSSEVLVPGDIVTVQAGDRVPADLRLLQSRDLQVAEAALTGESAAVQKSSGAQLAAGVALAERINMVYASTLVISGQASGIVIATGDATEIGRISTLIAGAGELETPLTRKIASFSRMVLYVILALAGVTFLSGVLRGQGLVDTFSAAVALAVAMIPEGLPAALTLTLAIGVTRMARRRAIIRKLPTVETLGSVTVICSDKTGTLTQNQMMVQEINAGGQVYPVSGSGYAPAGQIRFDSEAVTPGNALMQTLRAGLLCNDSRLVERDGQWIAEGDPTEVALISSARKGGLDPDMLRRDMPRLDMIPFDSRHQYMATLHACADSSSRTNRVIYLKGAAEVILERCELELDADGRLAPFDPQAAHQQAGEMAGRGLRVLAFAMKNAGAGQQAIEEDDLQEGLVFLGLQGMIDPPRSEAIAAVQACQRAGIQVKMITGDHPLTAETIARQIGLIPPGARDGTVISGRDLAAYQDRELIDVARRAAVFARVTPEQKLRLVEALQARGEVVAMTGDGVNDGPALKQSNVGIAMGITGTEVAKEAADMLLTDDNFSTIEAAVEEGRSVFDNLTKIIAWTLPTNLGQGLIILVAILAGITLPILPIHVLWINTITATVLGLVLAMEQKEQNIMQRQPRRPDAPILTRPLVMRIALVGGIILAGAFGLYEAGLAQGLSVAQARTLAVNVIVVIEIFYLFNCRSLVESAFGVSLWSNRWLWPSIAVMLALQVLFTYSPWMNSLMSTAPIGPLYWLESLAVGLASFAVVEVEKWLRRKAWQRGA